MLLHRPAQILCEAAEQATPESVRYPVAMATAKSNVWWSWGACMSAHVCFGGVKGGMDERAAGFLPRLGETVVGCDVTHTHTHTHTHARTHGTCCCGHFYRKIKASQQR